MTELERKSKAFDAVAAELEQATEKFGAFPTAHHGYAVILEEMDELWDDLKANDHAHARKECVQVAAMAIRMLMDVL